MSAQRLMEVVGGVTKTEAGAFAQLTVDASGFLKVTLAGGGGGDASAANQALEIAALTDLVARFPASQLSISAPWPVRPAEGGAALFPIAAAPANNDTVPSVTKMQVILSAVEPNANRIHKVDIDTSRRLQTVANIPGTATTSNSSSFQSQRVVAVFGCTVRAIEVFSLSAGYVVLVDKASALVGGEMPKGGSVWPIAAGGRVEKEWFRGKGFSAGCVIALCSSVYPNITVPSAPDALFTVQLD